MLFPNDIKQDEMPCLPTQFLNILKCTSLYSVYQRDGLLPSQLTHLPPSVSCTKMPICLPKFVNQYFCDVTIASIQHSFIEYMATSRQFCGEFSPTWCRDLAIFLSGSRHFGGFTLQAAGTDRQCKRLQLVFSRPTSRKSS